MNTVKDLLFKYEEELSRELGQPVEVFMRFKEVSESEGSPLSVVSNVLIALKINWTRFVSIEKTRDLVDARSIVSYILRVHYNLTLKAIGVYIHRDHATVIWGIKNYKAFISSKDKAFNTKVALCFKACGITEETKN